MVYVTIKRVGNSLGVVLPAGFVRQNELSENEIVEIEVRRMNEPLKAIFGTLERRRSGQEIKDELREGWGE
ncbi:MAG: AbrB/MazE/SpoVT family DNA-binding domain-containing protein [Thermoplasmatota archaeon]